ncbi:MAG: glycosyltransferase [Caldilineaceae bacterium]
MRCAARLPTPRFLMRVVLLSDCLPPVRNGVVHHVLLLARCLVQSGAQVHLVAPGPRHAEDGANVVRYPGVALGSTGYFAGWPTDSQVWSLLTRADIVHTHHPFLSGAIAVRATRLSGAPLVFTSHTRYDLYLDAYLPWLPARRSHAALTALLRRFGSRCTAVIAPSTGAAEALAAWGVTAPVEVIPNGINVLRFAQAAADPATRSHTRNALGLARDATVALYVGRLSSEKRVMPLLAAFAAACRAGADCRLLVVGAGAQAQEMRDAAVVLGVADLVHLAGGRAYEEMPEVLAAADFFVSASLSESHPLTFLEAAAAGLPALGYDAPGVRDIVVDGVTGLLAPWPPATPEEVGADPGFVLRWLALAGNAALRARLGAAAQHAAQDWGAERTAARVLALYERLLNASDAQGRSRKSVHRSTDPPPAA